MGLYLWLLLRFFPLISGFKEIDFNYFLVEIFLSLFLEHGVCWASCICRFVIFIKFSRTFLDIVFSNLPSAKFPITHKLLGSLSLSHSSLMLCPFFTSFLVFWVSFWTISAFMSLHSQIFSSALFYLLLIPFNVFHFSLLYIL